MNSRQAHQLVAISVAVMLGYGLVSGKGKQLGGYKQVWAIGVLGVFLSLIADFAPGVGGPLAGLFALGFVAGGQDRINGIITGAAARKSGGSAAPSPQSLGLLGPQGRSTVQAQGAPVGVLGPQG